MGLFFLGYNMFWRDKRHLNLVVFSIFTILNVNHYSLGGVRSSVEIHLCVTDHRFNPGINPGKHCGLTAPCIMGPAIVYQREHLMQYCGQFMLDRTVSDTLHALKIFKRISTRRGKRRKLQLSGSAVINTISEAHTPPIHPHDRSSWKIKISPGDGHCLLYSVHSSWNHQIPHLPRIDMEKIKSSIFVETVKNCDYYLPFTDNMSKTSLLKGMRLYLLERRYNQCYGDLAPVIIANALHVSLTVLNENPGDEITPIIIEPRHLPSKAMLYLHRKGEHYNGVSHQQKVSGLSASPLAKLIATSSKASNIHQTTSTSRDVREAEMRIDHPHLKVLFIGDAYCEDGATSPNWQSSQHGRNTENLILVHLQTRNISSYKTFPKEKKQIQHPSTFGLLNAQSVNNKCELIVDYIIENSVDIMAITETWLVSTDTITAQDLTPSGYKCISIPRTGRRGGGIALLHRQDISMKSKTHSAYQSFENMEVTLCHAGKCVTVCIIYRPPPSGKNRCSVTFFMEEFSNYLDHLILSSENILIVGDFNFHVDSSCDPNAKRFLSLLDSFNLCQHVTGETHVKGHTLDLVISRSSNSVVRDVHIDTFLSDHAVILGKCFLARPPTSEEIRSFRQLRKVDINALAADIKSSELQSYLSVKDINILADKYNSVMSNIINTHAPLKEKRIILRNPIPWITEDIHIAKKQLRQIERRWRQSKLTVHRDIFTEKRNQLRRMINQAKTEYYSGIILESSGDSKTLFNSINRLLCGSNTPTSNEKNIDSLKILVQRFGNHFHDKIVGIRSTIEANQRNQSSNSEDFPLEESTVCNRDIPSLDIWQPTSQDEVMKLIKKMPCKSCSLDPLPTWLMHHVLVHLIPVITHLINVSLTNGTVPDVMKSALVTPILKKPNLDSNICNNYRPISNLSFISKVLEKVIAHRLMKHLNDNNLQEPMQSAYKANHSTETALLRVTNDIRRAMDLQQVSLLVMLDMSAAFDTIDHQLLLNRMQTRLNITGAALAWFKSYLCHRSQIININGVRSETFSLKYGVPQGSVLGPLLFGIYLLPLGDLLRTYGLCFHQYADDTQIYMSMLPKDNMVCQSVELIQKCIIHVKSWMNSNMLKLNPDKTELLMLGSPHSLSRLKLPSLHLEGTDVPTSSSIRNLGVIFDQSLSLNDHITYLCKSINYHLRNIGKIRKYLSTEAAQRAIHALITSRLDYSNSLLFGLPVYQLNRLQRLQNNAARVVARVKKYEHITPVLRSLHWLPVKERVKYKILLLTFKVIQGLSPQYISELIITKQHGRNLRSNSKFLLQVPRTKTATFGDRSFSCAAPKLWNELPPYLHSIDSLVTFKTKLKSYLFKEAYISL